MATSQDTATDVLAAKLPTTEYFSSPEAEERPMTDAELTKLRRSNPMTYVISVSDD